VKFEGFAESTRFSLDAHDFAVEASATPFVIGCCANNEPEHAIEMTLERRGDLLDRREPRSDGPSHDCPALQIPHFSAPTSVWIRCP
jgi:hypothetical protein